MNAFLFIASLAMADVSSQVPAAEEPVNLFASRTVSRTVVRSRAPIINRSVVVQRNVVVQNVQRVNVVDVHAAAVVRQRVFVQNAFAAYPFVPQLAVHAYAAPAAVYAAPAFYSAPAYCAPAATYAPQQLLQSVDQSAIAAELRALREEFSQLSKAMRGLK